MSGVTATVAPDKVETIVTPGTVTITLPMEHANTLMAIFYVIGGRPSTTRRGHVDEIRRVLHKAGVPKPTHDWFASEQVLGSIYFAEGSLP